MDIIIGGINIPSITRLFYYLRDLLIGYEVRTLLLTIISYVEQVLFICPLFGRVGAHDLQ